MCFYELQNTGAANSGRIIFSSPKDIFLLTLKRDRNIDVRGKHQSAVSHMHPDQESAPRGTESTISLIYRTMLQPTESPGQGGRIIIWAVEFEVPSNIW